MPSRTFDFTGRIGQSAFPEVGPNWSEIAWATTPWERQPILIVGVCLDLHVVSPIPQNNGPSAIEGFVGNSYVADQMTPTRRATCEQGAFCLDLTADIMLPKQFFFAFPAANAISDPTDPRSPGHLDCHVKGTAPLDFTGSITIFYDFPSLWRRILFRKSTRRWPVIAPTAGT